MTLERWLQVHVAALCFLGSLFIASNTGNFLVPAGVLFAGITSIIFTDAYKWFRLNRLVGNVFAVGAVFYALRDFLGSRPDDQLLAIATLLVYMEVVLLYQEKNIRLYWQIILLTLLEVVVGAALNAGFGFGLLLLAYTATAVSTLVMLFVHGETERHWASYRGAAKHAKGTGDWLGAPIAVSVGGSRREVNQAFMSSALLRQIVTFTLAAITFAVVFFYWVPRHPKAAWNSARGFSTETGFSRDVELQQMGRMLQNNSEVMRVKLFDAQGNPLKRIDPYFAGEVLSNYRHDGLHATWTSPSQSTSNGLTRIGVPVPNPPVGAAVQWVRMKPMPHTALFTIAPSYATNDTPHDVRLDSATRLLFREPLSDVYGQHQELEFTIATTGIREGRQAQIIPHTRRLFNDKDRAILLAEIEECLQIDRSRFPGLCAKADDIIVRHGLESRSPMLVARVLEDYFVSSGEFTYSLNLNVRRDPALDPIEDFVMNHRTGHCQYYASALVFMLRSQGIPARMVVGYRGDEYNEAGQYYLVRQRNAHAWVEAYLHSDQVSEPEAVGGKLEGAGAWLRLDPTPEEGNAVQTFAQTWLGTARDWLDYVDTMWSDYVVGLNQQRQQAAMYGRHADAGGADALPQAEYWMSAFRTLASWFGVQINRGEGRWNIRFDWRASVAAMGLCLLLIALVRLGRYFLRRFDFSWLRPIGRLRGRRSAVAFYARLEDLLSRRGRSRRPAETAREYVEHAIRELSLARGDILRQTVEAFYRVRFGGAELSAAEARAVDQALADLEGGQVSEAA
jgi:protein-glutamine gamma-glutamyltransferase